MKTKTINVYEYEELSQKAKEKVLNDFREHNDFYFLQEDLKELLKEKLQENKISFDESLKLYYSLSYCQGDGLCFIGDFEFKGINIKIKHNSRYYYAKSTNIYYFDDEGNEIENEKTKEFENIYLNICKELEKIGYEIIEDEQKEENIKDFFDANNITFRENGEIENL